MAITEFHWRNIKATGARGVALSAGYPDLLIDPEDFPIRENTDYLQKHHGWGKPVPESEPVFQSIGLTLSVIDRARYQGSERVVDLNDRLDLGSFDLVIDPGTIEHCFNIPQALANLAGAVKVGGYISHSTPMAMFGHGFYNVNPELFWAFYRTNGFEIEHLSIVDINGEHKDINVVGRLKNVQDGAVVLCVAKRVREQNFVWPQQ